MGEKQSIKCIRLKLGTKILYFHQISLIATFPITMELPGNYVIPHSALFSRY